MDAVGENHFQHIHQALKPLSNIQSGKQIPLRKSVLIFKG